MSHWSAPRSAVTRKAGWRHAAGGQDSILTVNDSKVRRNRRHSGGIVAATVNLTGSTVSGNHSINGGGITAGTATLTNCTVSGNTAGTDGGGINATTANLTNCTVSGNSPASTAAASTLPRRR